MVSRLEANPPRQRPQSPGQRSQEGGPPTQRPLDRDTPGRNMGPDRKWHHTPSLKEHGTRQEVTSYTPVLASSDMQRSIHMLRECMLVQIYFFTKRISHCEEQRSIEYCTVTFITAQYISWIYKDSRQNSSLRKPNGSITDHYMPSAEWELVQTKSERRR